MLTLSTLKFYPRAWRIGTMKAVGRRRRGGPGAGDRRRRAGYHHGNLRRALLDAALALVEREGADALTLRAAARRAGVSQAPPYRHFRDKEALLGAVAEEGFRAVTEAVLEAAAAALGGAVG